MRFFAIILPIHNECQNDGKTKLKGYREIKGLSQKLLAEKLCIDVSNYARREKGTAKITNNEWVKLSEILETPLEHIFQADEEMTFIYNDHSSGNSGNHFYSIPQFMIEHQKKYIEKLKQEINSLKEKLAKL